MSNINSIKSGTVLSNRWKLTSKVGEGAFGWVYDVESVCKGGSSSGICTYNTAKAVDYDLVVKIISTGQFMKKKEQKDQIKNCNTLNYEYDMIAGHMADFPYRPRVPEKFYDTDTTLGIRYLVMEKMDYDLQAYATLHHPLQSGNIAEVATFGLQILRGLQWLHERNLLFIDVKPQNFLIKGGNIYFIDFGLVEIPNNKRNPARGLIGTPTFASMATHGDCLLNFPRDDVEAMAYSLLSAYSRGLLPWSGAQSDEQCIKMKRDCDIMSFASTCGMRELGEIVMHCRTLKDAASKPDYSFCNSKLLQMQTSKGKSSSSSSSSNTAVAKVAMKCGNKKRSVTLVDVIDENNEYDVAPMDIVTEEHLVVSSRKKTTSGSKTKFTSDVDVVLGKKSAARKRK